MLISESCDDEEAVGRGGGRGGNRSTDDDVVVGLGVANTTGEVIIPLFDESMEGSDAVQALVASLQSL